MKFNPKTKEELDSMNLLPAGVYRCNIANADDAVSKNGNEMIKLNLEVYDIPTNTSIFMFDYLLEAMPKKLHAFCEATGLNRQYTEGTLRAQDCINKSAYVEITIQRGKDNPTGGVYPDKNEVKKYMTKQEFEADKAKSSTPSATKPLSDIPFDEDIPF